MQKKIKLTCKKLTVLPIELLLDIFMYLDVKSRFRCRGVCKYFNSIVENSPFLWKEEGQLKYVEYLQSTYSYNKFTSAYNNFSNSQHYFKTHRVWGTLDKIINFLSKNGYYNLVINYTELNYLLIINRWTSNENTVCLYEYQKNGLISLKNGASLSFKNDFSEVFSSKPFFYFFNRRVRELGYKVQTYFLHDRKNIKLQIKWKDAKKPETDSWIERIFGC